MLSDGSAGVGFDDVPEIPEFVGNILSGTDGKIIFFEGGVSIFGDVFVV